MSNISIEKLIETITTIFITATETQEVRKGKVSVEALLESFSSDEVKNQLKNLIKQGMQKQTRGSGEKNLKDENAPKRPKSGYMFFCEKKRLEIKASQPELKVTEVAKVLGERWKSATPETKAKYSKKSEADKVRYNAEKAEYKRPSDEELMKQKINQKKKRGKQSGTKKRTKPEGAPTRGKSAYLFFCADKRAEVKAENPDLKATEILAELGRLWKELSDEDKNQYNEQAAEAKEKYLQDKTEWEEANGVELNPKKSKAKAPKKATMSKAKSPKPDSEEESEPESPKVKAKSKKPKPVEKPESEAESESEPESPKVKAKKSKSQPVSPVSPSSPAPKSKKVFA